MKKLVSIIILTLLSLLTTTTITGCASPHYRQHKKASSLSTSTYNNKASSKIKIPKSYEVYEKRHETRTFSKAMRQKKFDEQSGICAHCGKKCGSISEMHGDHIVPYSKGGKTEYSNLQMLCPKCNLSKGNRYSY